MPPKMFWVRAHYQFLLFSSYTSLLPIHNSPALLVPLETWDPAIKICLNGSLPVHPVDVLVVKLCSLLELAQVSIAVSNRPVGISISCVLLHLLRVVGTTHVMIVQLLS